ncbi:site-specific integrase [Knoellia locipacati]|uniref:tyrosine-type recombinase/integrase n=1 Tax=Knoellia locipacati TaxID=882824 RepID=UPI00384DEDF5
MAQVRDGVVKRGKSWSYVIRVTNPDTGLSKPKWVSGFQTEAAAKAARDEARVAARRGEFVNRSTVTVSSYLSDWLDGHALEVRPRTLSGYREILDRYVVPRIGRMRLQAVQPATLTRLYLQLLEGGGKNGRPLSRRTVDYVHATLRKALGDAVLIGGLIPSNPAERAKRPRRVTRQIGDVWDAEQLRTFLEHMADHQWFALYRLAAYTGARRGELLALRWADVDWNAPSIRIRASAGMVGKQRVEGTTKSGRERTVSIDPGTVAALQRHRNRQMQAQTMAGASWVGEGHLFVNGFGKPICPSAPSQRLSLAVAAFNEGHDDKADSVTLPRSRFHDLRHVHATLLLRAGVPVHVVAARLGHADPAITLRVYAHVIKEHAAEVAGTFAALLEPPEEADPEGEDESAC